jgi:hypothetical protein
MLQKISELKKETGENCIMKSFIICTHHQILLGKSKKVRGVGHTVHMGQKRNAYKILVEN